MGKVVTQEEFILEREQLRAKNKRVIFTNGCFDILHRGHVGIGRKNLACVNCRVNSDASAVH